MQRLKPLIPVPKVLVPAIAGLVALAVRFVATNEFDREEAAFVVGLFGYALIGWTVPSK
jgi:hypothetical protein